MVSWFSLCLDFFVYFYLIIVLLYLDVVISTGKEAACESTNEVTLSLPDATQVAFQIPWPVLVNGIKGSLQKDKESSYNLLLKKFF